MVRNNDTEKKVTVRVYVKYEFNCSLIVLYCVHRCNCRAGKEFVVPLSENDLLVNGSFVVGKICVAKRLKSLFEMTTYVPSI